MKHTLALELKFLLVIYQLIIIHVRFLNCHNPNFKHTLANYLPVRAANKPFKCYYYSPKNDHERELS